MTCVIVIDSMSHKYLLQMLKIEPKTNKII